MQKKLVRLPYCCGGRSEGDGRSQLPGLVHVHVRVLAPAHRGPRAIAMAALVLPHHLERHLIFMRAASLILVAALKVDAHDTNGKMQCGPLGGG